MATMARGRQPAEGSPSSEGTDRTGRELGGRAPLRARYEALPHTPPGGKPPETPGPLSLEPDYFERRESVKGSQAAQKQRALDRFPPFEGPTEMRERGPMGSGGIAPPVGRPRAVTVMRP